MESKSVSFKTHREVSILIYEDIRCRIDNDTWDKTVFPMWVGSTTISAASVRLATTFILQEDMI